MSNPQQPDLDKSTPHGASAAAQEDAAAEQVGSATAAPAKPKPRWGARRSWAWVVAGATGALLAAAGLSVATPIVVQPGTTAGYLYFPKATQAEELMKAELLKLRSELDKLQNDTMNYEWNQAPTGGGWSLHRHISNIWNGTLNNENEHSLIRKIADIWHGTLNNENEHSLIRKIADIWHGTLNGNSQDSLVNRIAALESASQSQAPKFELKHWRVDRFGHNYPRSCSTGNEGVRVYLDVDPTFQFCTYTHISDMNDWNHIILEKDHIGWSLKYIHFGFNKYCNDVATRPIEGICIK